MGVAIMPHRVLQASNTPEYTYTGSHQMIDDGNGNWRIKLLTSGTLTFSKKPKNIDVFLVGGGGSGRDGGYGNTDGEYCGPGGGGGYTTTARNIAVTSTSFSIVVGAGGNNANGGTTSAFGQSASGGERGIVDAYVYDGGAAHYCYGGRGGSAGGSTYSVSASVPYGDYSDKIAGMTSAGGSNGSNTANYSTYAKGQGTTTREFGESSGALYAGGGGCSGGAGGAGGGGTGGYSSNIAGGAGTANTGGGGGGGPWMGGRYGAGGSGIVIIRNAR